MATRDELGFADIPDPAGAAAPRPPPPAAAPDEPSPTRAESARRRWMAVAIGAGWIAVLLAARLGLREDLWRAPVLAQLAVWALALPAGLALALRPARDGWPARATLVRTGLVAIAAAFVGLALLPVDGEDAPLTPGTVAMCLSSAIVLALPAALGAMVVLRRALLNAPALRGAMIGAVIGLAGTTAVHSHCPVVTTSHVLLAHGLPIGIFAAIGALAGVWRGRV